MSARTCTNCGEPLRLSARFCPNCGTEGEPPDPAAVEAAPEMPPATWSPPPGMTLVPAGWTLVPARRVPSSATAAMVTGIITWALLFVGIGIFTGFITAPIAIALGVAARWQIRDEPEAWTGSARATSGLWLGLAWMVLATTIVTLILFGSVLD